MKRQLISFMLAVLFPLASLADVWQDPKTKVNYEYTIGESTASVKAGNYSTSGSPDVSGDVTILGQFSVDGNEYTVTSIGSNAFIGCSSLTAVDIPESVNIIGDYVFSRCSSLKSITIPSTVTTIGYFAFSSTGITSIIIPNSVKTIGYRAFSQCGKLISATINTQKVGNWFPDSPLQEVILGENVVSIEDEAFIGQINLKSITNSKLCY